MSNPIIFLFLLLLTVLLPQTNSQCGENIFTDKDFLTCSPDHQLDSSMNEFPSFLKTNRVTQLTVDIIFNPVSSCTSATSLLDLFIITIKDPSGQETKILDFYWDNAGMYQAKTALGASTYNRGFSSAISFTTNKWLELVASIDFDNKYFSVGVNVPGQYYYYDTNSVVSFYSSALGFDIDTKFYFCTEIPSSSSGPNFQCSIKTLNIWYTFASGNSGRNYYGALSPVLAAYYRLDENTGSQISDATGTLASGSFGTPATNNPIWSSSTVGVEFTTANQYIELPVFSTTPSSHPFASQSFTISFWLKFTSATGSANIFRYSNSLLDRDNFGLYIDGLGYMTIAMGNNIYKTTATTPISPSVWTLITASYNIYAPAYSTYNTLALYHDQTRVCFSSIIVVGLYNFASSPYRVIIGGPNGFLGTIAHLRIFSPAANHVNDLTGCSASSPSYNHCAINLLTSDPLTCISYPCGGPNCDQCSGSTMNSCLSCASPYDYLEDISLCSPPPPMAPPETPPSPTNPVIKPTQTTTSTLTKVYNALTKGSSVGFSAAVAGKIFSNIKYLDIGYSLELQNALKYWKSSFVSMGLDLDPPQGLEDNIPEQEVPPTFEKYGMYSDFLMNFWEGTIVLLFIVALFGIMRAIEYLTKATKHKKFPYTTIRTARFMTQNLLYSQFYGIFADVLMFSVLTYRTPNPAKGLSSLGLVFSALLLITTTIILASQFYLLVRYQRLKKSQNALEKFIQESQGSLISFEDFKDTSLFRQSFVFLLVLRDFLFSLILTTLFEHPLAQTILILVLNLAMIALLLWSQPFKKRCNFFQQVFYELVTLAVNVSVIILGFKDHAGLEAYNLRQRTGKFIIITNLCFNFIVIAFLVYGLIMAAKEGYKDYKAKKAKKVSRIIDTSLQSEAPSHLMNEQLDSSKNKIIIQNSETSFLHPKNLKDGELPFKGMETSISANDTSDNQILLQNPQETLLESQKQDLSLLNIPRIINKNYANKRLCPSNSPQDQQQPNLINNSKNLESETQNISQNQVSSQTQNLHQANKNSGLESEIENQRGDKKAQNQRIQAFKQEIIL